MCLEKITVEDIRNIREIVSLKELKDIDFSKLDPMSKEGFLKITELTKTSGVISAYLNLKMSEEYRNRFSTAYLLVTQKMAEVYPEIASNWAKEYNTSQENLMENLRIYPIKDTFALGLKDGKLE